MFGVTLSLHVLLRQLGHVVTYGREAGCGQEGGLLDTGSRVGCPPCSGVAAAVSTPLAGKKNDQQAVFFVWCRRGGSLCGVWHVVLLAMQHTDVWPVGVLHGMHSGFCRRAAGAGCGPVV